MKSQSLLNFVGSLSNFQFKMLFTNEEEEIYRPSSVSCSKRNSRNLDDFQIFTDHLKLNERFKKTLYYGKRPSTECPSLPLSDVTLELFSKTVPNGGLDVLDMHYAASVSRKACISPCSMILAIMYLDQLRHKNPEYLQNVASCDLFLISMLVASKFLYDNGEDDEVFNAEWAYSANIDIKDLNNLEREFLAALNWEVFVKPAEFFILAHEIECKIALKEMSKRNWFTYTEISVLLNSPVPVEIIAVLVDSVIKVIVITTVAYVSAVLMMIGAGEICYKCISPMQRHFQVLNNDNDIQPSMTVSDSMLNVEEISPVTNLLDDIFHANFDSEWFHDAISDDENETLTMEMYSHPSAFNIGPSHLVQHDCKNNQNGKQNRSTFTDSSFNRQFTATGLTSEENCYVVYIEPAFLQIVPYYPKWFCSSEPKSALYDKNYPTGVCQNNFSKSLKE